MLTRGTMLTHEAGEIGSEIFTFRCLCCFLPVGLLLEAGLPSVVCAGGLFRASAGGTKPNRSFSSFAPCLECEGKMR